MKSSSILTTAMYPNIITNSHRYSRDKRHSGVNIRMSLKKALSLLAALAVFAALTAGCSAPKNGTYSNGGTGGDSSDNAQKTRISIITTLFPHYDFARAIAGDRAEVSMLLSPGVESHSYEPTPADIIAINRSDLFIYTGADMEAWADTILKSVSSEDLHVLSLADGIPLEPEHDDHGAEPEHTEKDGEEEHTDHDSDESHLHEYDPHIWTSPVIAKILADKILASLCEIDPDNKDYYTENADRYKEELDKLDDEFRSIVDGAKRKEIFIGDRFALRYFSEEYGLTCYSAYDSCSVETEPSAAALADMIDQMKEKQIPVIYYGELTDPRVARSLSRETGAEMLLLHSCHNVTKEEFESGVTYLSLMKQNAENLRKGLN